MCFAWIIEKQQGIVAENVKSENVNATTSSFSTGIIKHPLIFSVSVAAASAKIRNLLIRPNKICGDIYSKRPFCKQTRSFEGFWVDLADNPDKNQTFVFLQSRKQLRRIRCRGQVKKKKLKTVVIVSHEQMIISRHIFCI